MKRTIALLCAAVLSLGLVGCGNPAPATSQQGDDASAKQTISKGTPEEILQAIQADVDETTAGMAEELEKTKEALGEDFESYVENEQALLDWYAYVEEETEKLNDRIAEDSVLYFKKVVEAVDHKDDRALENAVDDYYDVVYEDAFDTYYDNIYEDAYDEVYDAYYDGLLDDAYDTVPYDEWSDARSANYKEWSRSRSDVYKLWSRSRSDIYDIRTDMYSAFYDNEFDVDEILGGSSKEDAGEAAAEQQSGAEAQAEPAAEESTSTEVSADFKKTMDGYESFFDGYVEFMKAYTSDGADTASMMTEYTNLMTEYSEMMGSLTDIDQTELSAADAAYYLEVTGRITAKLGELSEL